MEPNNSQEIDLLEFFKAIGKLFEGFFGKIRKFIRFLFKAFINLLFFLRKNLKYLLLGILLGVIIAYIENKDNTPVFKASINIKNNYNSYPSFKQKIDALNYFIKTKNYKELSSQLFISEEEAKQLKAFDVEQNLNDIQLLKEYNYYLQALDTVNRNLITFEQFKHNYKTNPQLSSYQAFSIYAYSPKIFGRFNLNFDKIFSSDSILIKKRDSTLSILKFKKNSIIRSLTELDSLRKVFNKVYINSGEANNSSSTSIILNTAETKLPEKTYDLYQKRLYLLNELNITERLINDKNYIVKQESSFPEVGIKINPIYYNPYIQFPIIGFLIVLAILILLEFNKFLKYYKEKQITNEEN